LTLGSKEIKSDLIEFGVLNKKNPTLANYS